MATRTSPAATSPMQCSRSRPSRPTAESSVQICLAGRATRSSGISLIHARCLRVCFSLDTCATYRCRARPFSAAFVSSPLLDCRLPGPSQWFCRGEEGVGMGGRGRVSGRGAQQKARGRRSAEWRGPLLPRPSPSTLHPPTLARAKITAHRASRSDPEQPLPPSSSPSHLSSIHCKRRIWCNWKKDQTRPDQTDQTGGGSHHLIRVPVLLVLGPGARLPRVLGPGPPPPPRR